MVEPEKCRDADRCGIRHDIITAEYDGRLSGCQGATVRGGLGFRAAERKRHVGDAIAAGELRDAPYVAIRLLADQHQGTVALVQLTAAARGKHRDDDVRHFRNL